ncbi:unnamed protein product [Callosobruchus maculatus]|uniref:Uncharacterized protein n=1 Tax=Callosobruchus maculatus TaxID=64391 RepID=A0A653DW88_CALMS|nr:unnamed protein product [Callosobruchus maculatus]VEN64020.1 unnamed protein product [Callosobruchus maculatus]
MSAVILHPLKKRSKKLFQTHILGLYSDKSNLIFLFIITSLLSVCSFVDGVHIPLDHTVKIYIYCAWLLRLFGG